MTSLRLLRVTRQFIVAIVILSGCGIGKNNVKSNIELGRVKNGFESVVCPWQFTIATSIKILSVDGINL